MDVSTGREACTGAILAGGRARRLGGRDKAALTIAGRRIVDHQLAALRALTDRIVIVARDPSAHADLGVPVVTDLVPGSGPLGGLYTALASASTPWVVALACDMPFVTAALLQDLVRFAATADAAVPRVGGRWHPLCAAYATRCAASAGEAIASGRLAIVDWLAGLRVVEVDEEHLARHGAVGRLLANVNTEDDYARALAHAAAPDEADGRSR